MSLTHTNESKLMQEVADLRTHSSQAKELYREVCHLLFFRYDIQPSANKLYQLVRKGTMATASQAVNNFWSELREKRRVDIEQPGLPESLREFAGEALSTLWKGALEVAKQNYQTRQLEIHDTQNSSKIELEQLKSHIRHLEQQNVLQKSELEQARKYSLEYEKRRLIDSQVIVTLKETVTTLQNEKSTLESALKNLNNEFSAELSKLQAALKLSDDRYKKLESKAMLELDRERQRTYKLESEISELKKALLKEHAATKSQTVKNQKLVNELRENISLIKGQLKESQRQQLVASNKLKQIERKKPFLG